MLLDTGGAFGIKYAAFGLILIYSAVIAVSPSLSIPVSFLIIEGTLFGFAPVLCVFIAVGFYGVPIGDALQHVSPFPVWFLYPLLVQIRSKERMVLLYTRAMFVGAILTLLAFAVLVRLFVAGRLDLIAAINQFTATHRIGFFGAKPLGEHTYAFFPNVYFRWSLLLLPAALLSLHEQRTGQFLIFVAAILTTLSTAAILFLLVGSVWIGVEQQASGLRGRTYMRRVLTLIVLLVGATTALYYSGLGQVVTYVLSKLSSHSHSTSLKLGHIRSIIDVVTESPGHLLFGTGVGSSFYSSGTHSVVQTAEVSHFELVREFGLLYAVAFFAYCFATFLAVRRTDSLGRILGIGLACLFVAAGTNPVLVSPIFFLILIMSRAYTTLSARTAKEARLPDRGHLWPTPAAATLSRVNRQA